MICPSRTSICLEFAAREMHHHAADAAVAHEQIRAAAHHEKRDLVQRAKAHQPREAFLRFGLRPKLRRAADAHRGVLGERLVELDRRRGPSRSAVRRACATSVASSVAGFVDIARAEADHAVARLEHAADFERDLFAVRLEGARRRALRASSHRRSSARSRPGSASRSRRKRRR